MGSGGSFLNGRKSFELYEESESFQLISRHAAQSSMQMLTLVEEDEGEEEGERLEHLGPVELS